MHYVIGTIIGLAIGWFGRDLLAKLDRLHDRVKALIAAFKA
jgi:hypothetical protein